MRATCAFLLFTVGTSAQDSRGTILGHITDSSGAAVARARVEATHVATNAKFAAITTAAGHYEIPFVAPGDYSVGVEHFGFRRSVQHGVQVNLQGSVAVDLTLQVGEASDSVTVTARVPLTDLSTADLHQVLEKRYVDRIVVGLNRRVMNYVQLAPAVIAGGGRASDGGGGQITIAGGGSIRGGVAILLDGIPNLLPYPGGLTGYVPAPDGVDEVRVSTTLFDAEYGRTNGGIINITTRAGSNVAHGALYRFQRFTGWNANTWTNNRLGIPRQSTDYHQAGGMLSAPVWIPRLYEGRDRTFFTILVEGDSDSVAVTKQYRVPTDLERRGDFSQTLSPSGSPLNIYDPSTTIVAGAMASRQPFAGARIPAARLNQTGLAVLAAYPVPNVPGARIGQFNYSASGTNEMRNGQLNLRVDHAAGERHRIFARVGKLTADTTPFIAFSGVYADPQGTVNSRLARTFLNAAIDDTITFSPNLSGSIRFGFSRRVEDEKSGALEFDPATLNLPAVIRDNQSVRGWPAFRLGENMPVIGSNRLLLANDLHSLIGSFRLLRGRHSLRFGGDYRVNRFHRASAGGQSQSGDFAFSAVFTQSDPFRPNAAQSSGSSMASLLLGAPVSGSLGSVSPLSLQTRYAAGFIQDSWKLHTRLTLNFGLRYEIESPYAERYNRLAWGFDEDATPPIEVPGLHLRGGLRFAGIDGFSRYAGKADGNNFGPRFGFAFSPYRSLVVRGGYGLYYSAQDLNSTYLGEVEAFDAITAFTGSVDNGATIYRSLSDPFPNGLRRAPGASAGLLAQYGDSISFYDGRRVSPYSQQWQLSMQTELPFRILAEAAYLGTLNLKQFETFDLNEKPDQFLALGASENVQVTNPFYGILPAASSLGSSATIAQRRLWSRHPQFVSANLHGANTGRAIYHALQLRADKRATRGLSVLWNYSWSKLIDNHTTSLVNVRHYRSIAAIDQPHSMRLAFVYEMRDRLGWQRILGGWSISGFVTVAAGLPLSITHANGRPIRIRNPALEGVLNPWFDTGAFVPLPSQYSISPEPPYFSELRAPATRTINAALFKNILLRERFKAELRGECTGLTNTPQFAAPATNMSNLATFGVIMSAGGARQIQLGMRLAF